MTESLCFGEATNHQQMLTWNLNGVFWAPPLSLDSYIARESQLSKTAYASHSSILGGTKSLILYDASAPEEMISGLEATAKHVLIADKNGTRRDKGFAIASVYTNPKYRAKGMAAHLLARAKEFMDAQSSCSALYSDIGIRYYAKLGWKVYPSLQVSIILDGKQLSEAYGFPETVALLKEKDVEDLCQRDVAAVEKYFSELKPDGKTHVTFLPTWEQIQWHFTRDGIMAKSLYGKDIVNRGAITQDQKAWILWDHDFREKKLKIMRIVAHDSVDKQTHVQLLLRSAVAEAAKWEALEKVLVWNPDEAVSLAAKGVGKTEKVSVVFDERLDGSIPSFRWKGDSQEETVWEFNEYASWC